MYCVTKIFHSGNDMHTSYIGIPDNSISFEVYNTDTEERNILDLDKMIDFTDSNKVVGWETAFIRSQTHKFVTSVPIAVGVISDLSLKFINGVEHAYEVHDFLSKIELKHLLGTQLQCLEVVDDSNYLLYKVLGEHNKIDGFVDLATLLLDCTSDFSSYYYIKIMYDYLRLDVSTDFRKLYTKLKLLNVKNDLKHSGFITYDLLRLPITANYNTSNNSILVSYKHKLGVDIDKITTIYDIPKFRLLKHFDININTVDYFYFCNDELGRLVKKIIRLYYDYDALYEFHMNLDFMNHRYNLSDKDSIDEVNEELSIRHLNYYVSDIFGCTIFDKPLSMFFERIKFLEN
jgi:hypothetical protein